MIQVLPGPFKPVGVPALPLNWVNFCGFDVYNLRLTCPLLFEVHTDLRAGRSGVHCG